MSTVPYKMSRSKDMTQLRTWRLKIGTVPGFVYHVDQRTKIDVGHYIRARLDSEKYDKWRWYKVEAILFEDRLLKVSEI